MSLFSPLPLETNAKFKTFRRIIGLEWGRAKAQMLLIAKSLLISDKSREKKKKRGKCGNFYVFLFLEKEKGENVDVDIHNHV